MKGSAVLHTALAMAIVLGTMTARLGPIHAADHRDFMGLSRGEYVSALDSTERGPMEWDIIEVGQRGMMGTMLLNGEPYLVQGTVAHHHDFIAVAFSPTGRGAHLVLHGHMQVTSDGFALAHGTYLFTGPNGDTGTFSLLHAENSGPTMSRT